MSMVLPIQIMSPIKNAEYIKKDLDALNTSSTGQSFIETSSPSSIQPVLVRTHNPLVIEGINTKQEPTDQENISPHVSSIDHQNVTLPLEELSGAQIVPDVIPTSKVDLAKIIVTEASITTRQLISFIFDRQTLATHTLSGKPSPAFLNRDRPLIA
nr:uncharacterized protein LOC106621731 [Bactrocera oleae]